MVIIPVRAGDHVVPSFERLIRQDRQLRNAHRAERTSLGTERTANFIGTRRTKSRISRGRAEFRFTKLMVAAQQHQHSLAPRHQHQALDLRSLRQARELAHLGDSLAPRRMKLLWREIALGVWRQRRGRLRYGLLAI